MPTFKVLEEFELSGEVRTVDSEVELEDEVAASLVAEGKIAPVE